MSRTRLIVSSAISALILVLAAACGADDDVADTDVADEDTTEADADDAAGDDAAGDDEDEGDETDETDDDDGGELDEPITISFGHFAPAVQPMEAAAANMAERVNERTDGMVTIETYPASALGSIGEQLQQLESGSLEMMFSNPSYLGELQSAWSIFDAPMVFEDEDHVREFARSDYTLGLAQDLLEERGIRILDPTPIFGARHLSTTGTPIRHPDDLSGISIRVHEAQTRRDLIEAWGANPVVTPTDEMYTAMQTGLADGQESPLSWQRDNNYWEVQDYITLTGHFVQSEFILINEDFFQELPESVQEILMEEAIAAGDEMTELYAEANEEAADELIANGMEIIEDFDFEAFQQATEPMWETWQSEWGEGMHEEVVERSYEILDIEEWQSSL